MKSTNVLAPSTGYCDGSTWARLERARDHLGEARKLLNGLDVLQCSKVAVILGSSRGGTSLLHALLQQHRKVIALDGEHTPFYKLTGVCYPNLASDRVECDHPIARHQLAQLFQEFASISNDQPCIGDWIDRFILRLPLQYRINFDFARIRRFLDIAHDESQLACCLGEVLGLYGLSSSYYDEDEKLIKARSAEVPPPCTYAAVEETPYVLPGVYRSVVSHPDLETKVLLLKASVDAYRIEWLSNLFSDSELYFIHEVRNPAASVNGLMDGWRTTRGFYSYRVTGLEIDGYTELHPEHRDLWCFDLPPNWTSFRKAPLERVCANQWEQAHLHILEGMQGRRCLRISYEDLVHGPARRKPVVDRLCRFLGIGEGGPRFHAVVDRMPVVMATERPQKNRWKEREARISLAVRSQLDRHLVTELCGGDGGWI